WRCYIRQGTILAGRKRIAAASPPVPPFVQRHGPQPVPEAPRPVVLELGQFANQGQEDVLDQVAGVVIPEPEVSRPEEEQGGIQLDEALPGGCLVWQPQEFQEAGGGGVHRTLWRRE